MARSIRTKEAIVGFIEQLKDNSGVTTQIDLKVEFGPVMEAYMKENVWLQFMDMVYNVEQKNIEKVNYSAIKETLADFDPKSKATGATVIPEEVVVRTQETKELAAAWYETDWKLSNSLEKVGNRMKEHVFIYADSIIDENVSLKYATAAEENTLINELELDIDSMTVTGENGKIVYEAILNQLLNHRATAAANEYSEASYFKNEVNNIYISIKVEELLTAYKSAFYIDETGLLNVGVFGTQFRNVNMATVTEMPVGKHVIIATERAIAGTVNPSKHFKYIPESINQTSYMDEVNNVFSYGFKTVFNDEVTAIKQAAVAPADAKLDTLTDKTKKAVEKLKEIQTAKMKSLAEKSKSNDLTAEQKEAVREAVAKLEKENSNEYKEQIAILEARAKEAEAAFKKAEAEKKKAEKLAEKLAKQNSNQDESDDESDSDQDKDE